MVTIEQAEAARDKFIKEFYKYPPINGVGVTFDEHKQYAVYVMLEEAEKPDNFPNEIDKVKIIYNVVGKIVAQ